MRSTEFGALGDAIRMQAAARPDAVALVYHGRTTSYAALDQAANRVAAALIRDDVAIGERVCILAKNSDRYLECLFGAAKAGAVLTPVNWRLAPAEIEYIVNDAQARILIVDAELLANFRAADCPRLTTVIVLEGDAAGEIGYAAWTGDDATADPRRALAAADIAVQMYTSGTTGRPKGAMLSHGAFIKMCDLEGPPTPAWFRVTSADTCLLAVPLFHIGGTEVALRPLFSGGRVIIHREFDAASVLRDIAAFGVTSLSLVPTVLQMVIEHPDAATTDFSSVRHAYYGSSPIPLDLLRDALRTLKCGFVQVYGLTETTGAATSLPPDDHDVAGTPRMRSAGKPSPGFELSILDADGAALPPHAVGEIAIRSKSLMSGYWGMPEASAAAIDANGWFRSGDAGYLDEDGYLFIHDRVKDMIKSGAENIYPAEIENAIFAHPQVQEVAVIGVPDRKWGEAVKAVIVAREGETIDEAQLLGWVRTRIAGYKVPRSIDLCAALPRNASGKVLKTELRKPYWAGHTRGVN